MTNSIVKGNSRCDMIAWSELGHGDPSGVRLNAYIELGVVVHFLFFYSLLLLWEMIADGRY